MRFWGWLLPLGDIAASLRELASLYRLDLETRRILNPTGDIPAAGVFYQDDLNLAEGERKRLEWMASGGRPIFYGDPVPGPL